MLSGRWVAASGIACVDDEARARTKATLIILIIWRSSIITFLEGAAEADCRAIGPRGNNVRVKSSETERRCV
jgi:hypothetical protein